MGDVFDDFNAIRDIERFDQSTEKWELVSSRVPMSLPEPVAMNGYIYAIGYVRGKSNPIIMIQIYDPASCGLAFPHQDVSGQKSLQLLCADICISLVARAQKNTTPERRSGFRCQICRF
ncbi:hypothetical protein AVEN_217980-1 [Araneus ventricosus]|uniref:Uncharacterized protein n=1 Tax=Araneus ventricosus TaxID=182803 RepID=A0A4Y2DKH7_ARAVE|nr:hypothetical protein AVEN_217980-1 [Araneus ventricosus]